MTHKSPISHQNFQLTPNWTSLKNVWESRKTDKYTKYKTIWPPNTEKYECEILKWLKNWNDINCKKNIWLKEILMNMKTLKSIKIETINSTKWKKSSNWLKLLLHLNMEKFQCQIIQSHS